MKIQHIDIIEEAIKELNRYKSVHDLYEHKDSRIIYRIPNMLKSQGGIDLRGTKVDTTDDVAQICKMYRDERFETFRIIYTKGNTIVGSQGMTSRLPGVAIPYLHFNSSDNIKNELTKSFEYYNRTMKRLGADGYFIIHNHPSGTVNPSEDDMRTTNIFMKFVPGFRGHIIIGRNRYTFIDDEFRVHSSQELTNEEDREIKGKILNQDDIRDIVSQLNTNSNSSIILYTNARGIITAIEELKNSAFNDKTVFRYIQKQQVENGASRVFLYTSDEEVYDIGCYAYGSVFSDVVLEGDNNRYINPKDDTSYNKYIKNYSDAKNMKHYNVN